MSDAGNANNGSQGWVNPGQPTTTPVAAAQPTTTTQPAAPIDPALSSVIQLAKDAVAMDQAGRYKDAKQSYMFAAEELISVYRSTTDSLRKLAYRRRAETYLKRAETLDKMLRQQVRQQRIERDQKKQALWYMTVLGKELCTSGSDQTVKPSQELIANKKIVCVFFGSHQDKTCESILLSLVQLYTLVKEAHEGELEIVYAPQDRTQKDFDTFYLAQPWFAYEPLSFFCLFNVNGLVYFILRSSKSF